jgi:hypothetical protein
MMCPTHGSGSSAELSNVRWRLLVGLSTALVLLAATFAASAAWSVITINASSSIDEGMYPSAAIDSSGYLRIACLRTSSYDLMYYYRTWLGGVMETAVSTGNVGQHCSMALDSGDVPYVSYFDGTTTALDYAWRNGSWTDNAVTISVTVNSTSIDIDTLDRPHIAYTVTGNSNLYYKWNTGTWILQTLVTSFDSVTDCSLDIDAARDPHIAYRFKDGTDYGVRYSYHDGSTWHHTVVEQGDAFGGMDPSVAAGSTGLPQISYGSWDLERIWYDGSDWHTEVVDDLTSPDICMFTSLALDGMDRPHIAYLVYNSTADETRLKYTWHDGSSWHPETIETMNGQAPCSISLVLGASSYIAYYDPNVTNGSLKYATYNHPPIADAGPDLYVVDTAAGGWGTEPVDLDGTGSYDPDGSLTSYSWKEGVTEIGTTVDPTVDLTVGTHDVDLIVTDNNATDSPADAVQVQVISPTAATFRVDPSGRVFADATFFAAAFEAGSADIAEWVGVSEPVSPGDVLEFDPFEPGRYRLSSSACSRLVAGVVSTEPGLILGASGAFGTRALLALSGIVPVNVTDEGGPIRPGDLLVTSPTPGHAMRWSGAGPCPLIGKALEPMIEPTGTILTLLAAH